MPVCAVTSTNSIGPLGRALAASTCVVAVDGGCAGVGEAEDASGWGVAFTETGVGLASLLEFRSQPATNTARVKKRTALRLDSRREYPFATGSSFMRQRGQERLAANRTTFRSIAPLARPGTVRKKERIPRAPDEESFRRKRRSPPRRIARILI